jgi:hypothetical protein
MKYTSVVSLFLLSTLLLTASGLATIKEKKLRGFSPQANYTDRATDACRRS